MCGEGGCGACVVAIESVDALTQTSVVKSANSCLRLLCSVDGQAVTTVEALGGNGRPYNVISQKMAEHNGTQCGYCSSGFVMEMYSLLETSPVPTAEQVEQVFDGHICRCTGYRAILDAMHDAVPTDIEEMDKVKKIPCARLPCGVACQAKLQAALTLQVVSNDPSAVQWLTVTSLPDLFTALATYAGRKIQLVVGNTAAGVFKGNTPDVYLNIAGIPDLLISGMVNGQLTVGAAVSIASLIELLEANGSVSASFAVLARHLGKIANKPVRNMACWAGNLMLTHDNPNFPSDIFTIMAAAGAQVKVGSSAGVVTMSLFAFLQTDMVGRVILAMSIPPLAPNERLATYKIMPRHSNAHAYVNAGLRLTVDPSSGVVTSLPVIVFGGIGPYAVSPAKTPAFLLNRSISDIATVQAAAQLLSQELSPDAPPAAASAAYRRALAVNLFYKAIITCSPDASPRAQGAATVYERAVSKGSIDFDAGDPAIYPVSKPMPKATALLQTSGEAIYVNDLAASRRTLYAAFALAAGPPGTLASITVPEGLVGVVRVIQAPDIPGDNLALSPMVGHGEPLLVPVGGEVAHDGQPIAIVLADTQKHADAAAKLVTATVVNQKKPLITVQDAITAGSFLPCAVQPLSVGRPRGKG